MVRTGQRTDNGGGIRTEAYSPISVFGCLAVGLLSFPADGSTGSHGRFLPAEAKTTDVATYGNVGVGDAPVEFDADKRDTVKDIDAGDIRFTYDTYVGPDRPPLPPPPPTTGGAWLSGGFFMNPGVKVKDGFRLMWVQTVVDNTNAGGEPPILWNLPQQNAGEFPDAGAVNKKYINGPPARVPPGQVPTLGYSDRPSRSLARKQSWRAELGLVCIETAAGADGVFDARVIGTFNWGFDIANQAPPARGIEDVTAHAPGAWGAPPASYLTTLNNFYDGCGGGGGGAQAQRFCNEPPSSCAIPCTLNSDCDPAPGGGGEGRCQAGLPPINSPSKYRFAANTNCFEKLPRCPDGEWQPEDGENACTCPDDAPGECPFCGDGFCQRPEEDACGCPEDCLGECPGCGDGVCDEGEDGCICAVDCGECPFCGDGLCGDGDDVNSCRVDCFEPTPTVSEWGLIVMAMLVLTAGTVVLMRRRRATA